MELAFLWLLFAVMTAVVAGSKGRNWFGWLIIGLLIGIFGLILVAVMPRVEGPVAVGRGPAVKSCPDCGETVLARARVCKHCGYRFSGQDEQVPEIEAGGAQARVEPGWDGDTSKGSDQDRAAHERRNPGAPPVIKL